jgi:hypothetical protein
MEKDKEALTEKNPDENKPLPSGLFSDSNYAATLIKRQLSRE